MLTNNVKRRKLAKKLFFYVGILLFLFICLFPFFIMLMTSFKSPQEAISKTPTIFPKEWTFEHFIDIFNPNIFPYLTYLENSFVVSITAALISRSEEHTS